MSRKSLTRPAYIESGRLHSFAYSFYAPGYIVEFASSLLSQSGYGPGSASPGGTRHVPPFPATQCPVNTPSVARTEPSESGLPLGTLRSCCPRPGCSSRT